MFSYIYLTLVALAMAFAHAGLLPLAIMAMFVASSIVIRAHLKEG